MKKSIAIVAAVFVAVLILAGCGKGKSDEVRIPEYPGAQRDQSYNMGDVAKVERFFTDDSYEDVVEFYKDKLSEYEPDIQEFEAKGSRQTKMDIVKEEKRAVTVVIQQFDGEDKVAIVFMGVSL